MIYIYEALCYMHVTIEIAIVGMTYQLPLTPIVVIFENIPQNTEQKMTCACHQTCYTSSTEGAVATWSYLGVLLHDANNQKYWIALRHYACN